MVEKLMTLTTDESADAVEAQVVVDAGTASTPGVNLIKHFVIVSKSGAK
jgi:hypothetical protein